MLTAKLRYFLAISIVAASGNWGHAWAAEIPMATHLGTKSSGQERERFLLSSDSGPEVSLPVPLGLTEKISKAKPDGHVNQIGVSRRSELGALPLQDLLPVWQTTIGGFAARFTVRSAGALRIRIGIVVPSVHEGMQIRFAPTGSDIGEILTYKWIRETYGNTPGLVWTPSTSGESQTVEIFLPVESIPKGEFGLLHDVSHLYVDPFAEVLGDSSAKLLGCHVNYSCTTNAEQLNAGKAVARMIITRADGSSGTCTGSLINDTAGTRRYFATAYHCVSASSEASSLQLGWFYEVACGGSTIIPASTTSQGSNLLRANFDNDFTLLQITGSIPAGATLVGWDSNALVNGSAVYGVHHPAGVNKAISLGSSLGKKPVSFAQGATVFRVNSNWIGWQSGITEPGSSGSPLLTGAGILRGTLSAVPRNQSCTAAREAYYSDFSLVYPLVQQWLNPISAPPDDYPNSAAATTATYDNAFLKVRLESAADQDWFKFTFPQAGVWILYTTPEPGQAAVNTVGRIYASNGTSLLQENNDDPAGLFGSNFAFYLNVASPGTFYLQVTGFQGATGSFELNSLFDPNDDHSDLPFLGTPIAPNQTRFGTIDVGGDSDYFILDVSQAGTLTLASSGSTDVVGVLRNSQFQVVQFNDDVSATDLNFRLSANVSPGRYYIQVAGYDVQTTGAYSVTASLATTSSPSFTGLWWNPAESGWGLNTNHQGDVVFATLFTYASDGNGTWLVASGLTRQSDGSYSGPLYRTTGPPYFTVPWTSISVSQVGTMTLRFASATSATLSYSFNGITVNKNIQRQVFGSPVPECTMGTGTRAGETNYQDLWWNPNESGWGVNITHQGNTLFATLFTYNNAGRDGWLVASGLARQADGSYTGPLYATTGPPFNSQPWSTIGVSEVGNMTFRFSAGNRGTLTYSVLGTTVVKSIERQVFGNTVPICR